LSNKSILKKIIPQISADIIAQMFLSDQRTNRMKLMKTAYRPMLICRGGIIRTKDIRHKKIQHCHQRQQPFYAFQHSPEAQKLLLLYLRSIFTGYLQSVWYALSLTETRFGMGKQFKNICGT